MARVVVRERSERSREMLVDFAPVDEERSVEVFEEVEAEYAVEDLNELEGLSVRVTDREWSLLCE